MESSSLSESSDFSASRQGAHTCHSMPTSSYESDSDLIVRSNAQSISISSGDTSFPGPDSQSDFEARSASDYSEGDPECESVLELFPNESDESDSCMEELEEVEEPVRSMQTMQIVPCRSMGETSLYNNHYC